MRTVRPLSDEDLLEMLRGREAGEDAGTTAIEMSLTAALVKDALAKIDRDLARSERIR